jgi:hypothetical protein
MVVVIEMRIKIAEKRMHIPMAKNDTLGFSGGSSGGKDGEDIVQSATVSSKGSRCAFRPVFQAGADTAVAVDTNNLHNAGTAIQQLLRLVSVAAVEQQQLTVESLQQIRIIRHGVARIDRQPNTLCPKHSQQGQECLATVGRQDTDMGALTEAMGIYSACYAMACGLCLHIVQGRAVIIDIDESDVVGVVLRPVIEVLDYPHLSKCSRLVVLVNSAAQ